MSMARFIERCRWATKELMMSNAKFPAEASLTRPSVKTMIVEGIGMEVLVSV